MRHLLKLVFIVMFLGIVMVSPAISSKIKHQGSIYVDRTGVPLKHPEGVACGDDESFIVADTANSRVVRYSITAQGLVPETIFLMPGASPIIAQMNSEGDVYLLDGKTRTIVKIKNDGQNLGKVEPKGAPDPKLIIPRSFRLGVEGDIYLLDIFSERVVILNSAEDYVRHIAFPTGYGFFSDLTISAQGDIFLLDSVSGAIYKATSGSDTFELLSGGLKEYMNFPVSLDLDSNGVIYLSDQNGSGLALVGPEGSFMGRKFGMGWEDGQLYYPAQLCINNQDQLIIADRNNSRVQVFSILEE